MKGKEKQKTAKFIRRNGQDMEEIEGSAKSTTEKNIGNKDKDWEINNPFT